MKGLQTTIRECWLLSPVFAWQRARWFHAAYNVLASSWLRVEEAQIHNTDLSKKEITMIE